MGTRNHLAAKVELDGRANDKTVGLHSKPIRCIVDEAPRITEEEKNQLYSELRKRKRTHTSVQLKTKIQTEPGKHLEEQERTISQRGARDPDTRQPDAASKPEFKERQKVKEIYDNARNSETAE